MCHRGMILGEKGVSLDDLVYATTKIMRQMDSDGMEAMISAADTVSQAVADAKPLVESTTKLIDQVRSDCKSNIIFEPQLATIRCQLFLVSILGI